MGVAVEQMQISRLQLHGDQQQNGGSLLWEREGFSTPCRWGNVYFLSFPGDKKDFRSIMIYQNSNLWFLL